MCETRIDKKVLFRQVRRHQVRLPNAGTNSSRSVTSKYLHLQVKRSLWRTSCKNHNYLGRTLLGLLLLLQIKNSKGEKIVKRPKLSFPSIFNSLDKTLRDDELDLSTIWLSILEKINLSLILHNRDGLSLQCNTAFLKKISSTCQWLLFNLL